MKVLKETQLRFITPAFLSGANQNEPEIRVPSIRGAVRWWFRALGGTEELEREVLEVSMAEAWPASSLYA